MTETKIKIKPNNLKTFKLCRNTVLICFFVAIIAYVCQGLPFYESLLNFSNVKILNNQDYRMSSESEGTTLYACDFEVYGKVQGVFFRKFTQKTAKILQLKGWCKNTADGTVQGRIEGEEANIEDMKKWLKETGSPKSRIHRTVFSDLKPIEKFSFAEFSIIR